MSIQASVVIPVYNSASTLARAVASAQRQTLAAIEIWIVDDGSTDGSLALARELAAGDPRVRVLALGRNGGKSRAMNTAIASATGEWIAVLDADDSYEPTRLAVLIAAAQSAGAALAADNQTFHDAGAGRMVRTAFPAEGGIRALDAEKFAAGGNPYAAFDYGMLKPVVRSAFIRDSGLAYREQARLSEDFLYLLEFFARGGAGVLVPEPLYCWTQAFGTVSRQWTTTGAGSWRYDYPSAIAAAAEMEDEMRRAGHDTLAQLLAFRQRAFHRLHSLEQINRMRAEHANAARIALGIARRPSVWPLLARRAFGSL